MKPNSLLYLLPLHFKGLTDFHSKYSTQLSPSHPRGPILSLFISLKALHQVSLFESIGARNSDHFVGTENFPAKMEAFSGNKRPTISLSLFTSFSESTSSSSSIKSPRNFQDGVVGLGIVAAMTDMVTKREVPISSKSPKSSPIPIISAAKPAANFRGGLVAVVEKQAPEEEGVVVDEFSESYTCVISHIGNNLTEKRVYFDDKKLSGVVNNDCVVRSGVFSASPPSVGEVGREFWCPDFLSSCCLCKKKLQGLDIFMYRGEKAFCSTECRDKHIRSDKYKEKCRSEAVKSFDFSVSTPCSSPLVFSTGVVVA